MLRQVSLERGRILRDHFVQAFTFDTILELETRRNLSSSCSKLNLLKVCAHSFTMNSASD